MGDGAMGNGAMRYGASGKFIPYMDCRTNHKENCRPRLLRLIDEFCLVLTRLRLDLL